MWIALLTITKYMKSNIYTCRDLTSQPCLGPQKSSWQALLCIMVLYVCCNIHEDLLNCLNDYKTYIGFVALVMLLILNLLQKVGVVSSMLSDTP